MNNKLIATLLATFCVGCVSTISPKIEGKAGLKFTEIGGNQYLHEYVLMLPQTGGDLPYCMAASISNKTVSLQDASNSFVGQATGAYHDIKSVRADAGGEVVKAVAADKSSVAAQGRTEYQFASGLVTITRYVQFDVGAERTGQGTRMTFTNLKQAQASTGVLANDGFSTIGAWEGTNPDLVLASLDAIGAKVGKCLDVAP